MKSTVGIFHLNCGSLRPYIPRVKSCCHCLLLETSEGLLLVDTGFGIDDHTQPTLIMRLFKALLRVPSSLEETALYQINRLGYDPEQVRHIVLTHLHLDHAGGLPDFPNASVHVHRLEYHSAVEKWRFYKQGYVRRHWHHKPSWVIHQNCDRDWFGFQAITLVAGLSPEILMVPLPGHTAGHCGVAIQHKDGWLFNCGDSATQFFKRGDPYLVDGPQPGLMIEMIAGKHVMKLRHLHKQHGEHVRIIYNHSPIDAFDFAVQ